MVPYLAAKVVDYLKISNGSYQEMAAEQVISESLFFAAFPFLWDNIDTHSQKQLAKESQKRSSDLMNRSCCRKGKI
jgi:hypothetical protein